MRNQQLGEGNIMDGISLLRTKIIRSKKKDKVKFLFNDWLYSSSF